MIDPSFLVQQTLDFFVSTNEKALDLIEYTRRTLSIEQNHYKAPYKTKKECLFLVLKKGIPYLLKTTKNGIIKVQLQGTSIKA